MDKSGTTQPCVMCTCNLKTKLTGDGCDECNPGLSRETRLREMAHSIADEMEHVSGGLNEDIDWEIVEEGWFNWLDSQIDTLKPL